MLRTVPPHCSTPPWQRNLSTMTRFGSNFNSEGATHPTMPFETYVPARLRYSKGLYPSSRNCSAITW